MTKLPSIVVTCPKGLQRNSLITIAAYAREEGRRPCPIAVGTMAIDSDTLDDDTKGKAALVIHVEGDELWNMGSKAGAPVLEVSTLIQDGDNDEKSGAGDSEKPAASDIKAGEQNQAESGNPIDEEDKLSPEGKTA